MSRWSTIVGAVLAVAVALLIGGAAGGASTTTVRIGSGEGSSGEQVTVRLEALGVPAPGLGAFTIDVTYDPSVASPVTCQKDPQGVFDTVLCNTSFGDSTVRVGGFRSSPGATGGVALADITFRLVGQEDACGSLSPTVAEFADTDAEPIAPLDLVAGSLCVGETPGKPSPTHTPAHEPSEPVPAWATSSPGSGEIPQAPYGEIVIVPPPVGEGVGARRAGTDGWIAAIAAVAAVAVGATLAGCVTYRRLHDGHR